uniref:Zinc finger protein 268 n=1 Tax=Equus caballus TaxID=9796 RepID=A0A9L0SBR2_HORSE
TAARVRTAAVWAKSGKLMIIKGIKKMKASWKGWQKTMNVLHLENCVLLVQIMFLQDKSFITVVHMERV